jgi:hypothetical protein
MMKVVHVKITVVLLRVLSLMTTDHHILHRDHQVQKVMLKIIEMFDLRVHPLKSQRRDLVLLMTTEENRKDIVRVKVVVSEDVIIILYCDTFSKTVVFSL